MPYLEIDNQSIEYIWYGPRTDGTPTLIFLHEGLGSVSMWQDFPARVSEATGYGAFIYSRAGYGESDPASLPRPVGFMHEEALVTLPKIMKSMNITRSILVGHSDGGSIALIHGGSERASGILALILEAPHVFVEDITIRSIAAAAEEYEKGNLRPRLQRHHQRNVDETFWGWTHVWLDPSFRQWNIQEYLPRIPFPVLVIQGEDDQFGTLQQVEALKAGCAGDVQTLILPACGHSPHREQTERTFEAMVEFISHIS